MSKENTPERPRSTALSKRQQAWLMRAVAEVRTDPELEPLWWNAYDRWKTLMDVPMDAPIDAYLHAFVITIDALERRIRARGLELAVICDSGRESYLREILHDLITGIVTYEITGAPPSRGRPHRIARLAPGNPLTIAPDGNLHGWREAQPKHFLQLRSYVKSFDPPGQPGRPRTQSAKTIPSRRPRLDPDLAARALQLKRENKKWPDIAKALGLPYDHRDLYARDAMRSRIRRLIERAMVDEKNLDAEN
jgi:hypothetical protein